MGKLFASALRGIRKKIFWGFWVVIADVYSIYAFKTTFNVPVMDYWNYLAFFLGKIDTGSLTPADFFRFGPQQANPLMYFSMYLNILLFHYNTQVEIFTGIIVLVFLSIFLYHVFSRHIHANFSIRQLLFVPVLLAIFNYNFWEINLLAFSFVFMLRLACYIVIFSSFDQCIRQENRSKKWLTSFFIVFSISMLSQAYFVALVISIYIGYFLSVGLSKKDVRLREAKRLLPFLVACIVGMFIYSFMITGEGSGAIPLQLFQALANPEFYKGLFLYLGASVVPQQVAEAQGFYWHYIMGAFLFLVCVASVALYFKRKMYHKKSYTFYASTAVLCLFTLSMVYSAQKEWFISPFRRAGFQGVAEAAQHLELLHNDEYYIFQSDRESVQITTSLLKKHKLSFFYGI